MSKRPTIKDIAREAGVSTATIDRALNGRMQVREETLKKISAAAHKVGYTRLKNLNLLNANSLPEVSLGIVLLKGRQEFYQEFSRHLEILTTRYSNARVKCTIEFVTSQSPREIAETLRQAGKDADAVAAVAVNHPEVDLAVGELRAEGIPVFSLLNDFALGLRTSYFGINNIQAGRVAAWMLHNTTHREGSVAVFVGGKRWQGHVLREVGFRSFFRETERKPTHVESLVNLETRQVTYEATLDLLDRTPDLNGIYVAGGGMEGAISALREVRPPGKVSLVVHELTSESRKALQEGYAVLAIGTPLRDLCERLVEQMITSTTSGKAGSSDQIVLEPRVFLPEMV